MADIHALLKAITDAGTRERQIYHLCLGPLIEKLSDLPPDAEVVIDSKPELGPAEPGSYRGYYADLAFGFGEPPTVTAFLAEAKGALGKTFEGYKGGDYTMTERTALWLSNYGMCSGLAVTDIRLDGERVVLVTRDTDA